MKKRFAENSQGDSAVRGSLRSIADRIFAELKNGQEIGVLYNIFGIDGMGKSILIRSELMGRADQEDVRVLLVEGRKIYGDTSTDDAAFARRTVEEVFEKVLRLAVDEKGGNTIQGKLEGLTGRSYDLKDAGLIEKFQGISKLLRQQREARGKPRVLVCIDDADVLPWGQMDWLQRAVIDRLSAMTGVGFVLTSHQYLAWYTWEIRDRRVLAELQPFEPDEIKVLIKNKAAAEAICRFSGGGHAATVDELARLFRQETDGISMEDDEHISVSKEFQNDVYEVVERKIEENLERLPDGYGWMRRLLRLIAVADYFTPDLFSEVRRGMNIHPPENEFFGDSDAVWDMRDAGLVVYDAEVQAYKVHKDLRGRILLLLRDREPEVYREVLGILVHALRGIVVQMGETGNWATWLAKEIHYFALRESFRRSAPVTDVVWRRIVEYLNDETIHRKKRDGREIAAALDKLTEFNRDFPQVVSEIKARIQQRTAGTMR